MPSNQADREQLIRAVAEEVRSFQAAVDAFDEAVADHLGINRTDLRVVDHLTREERVLAGRLAELTGLTTGAMTMVIDRLERAGLARRTRDNGDRRRVLVAPTAKARRAVESIYGPIGAEGQRTLATMTAGDLEAILSFLRRGQELNEKHAADLRGRRSRNSGRARTKRT